VFPRVVALKQLLVAMREATPGRAFDEIVRDEFTFLVAAIPTALQTLKARTISWGLLVVAGGWIC